MKKQVVSIVMIVGGYPTYAKEYEFDSSVAAYSTYEYLRVYADYCWQAGYYERTTVVWAETEWINGRNAVRVVVSASNP